MSIHVSVEPIKTNSSTQNNEIVELLKLMINFNTYEKFCIQCDLKNIKNIASKEEYKDIRKQCFVIH